MIVSDHRVTLSGPLGVIAMAGADRPAIAAAAVMKAAAILRRSLGKEAAIELPQTGLDSADAAWRARGAS